MKLIKRELDMLEENRLIKKWEPLLSFSSEYVCPIPPKDRAKYADILEQVEEKYIVYNNNELMKFIIPLVRRHGELAYFEEGIYTPTKDQRNYGKSFRALKFMNPDQKQSKFIAISLDPNYESVDRIYCSNVINEYSYTFDF